MSIRRRLKIIIRMEKNKINAIFALKYSQIVKRRTDVQDIGPSKIYVYHILT